ncbi:M81 family metallopeptidase [Salinarimonas soli]|uniref:Microcystinase C n=1 Tax=Salinarimonas soli TaxID=1638099 RepID=A0A5B2VYV8_9HYPH|nr:M81 family metallopeptidase [Salinarimonas soli]KAA2244195.1 M81 family metallopeptidase [Salinarimonas soli]
MGLRIAVGGFLHETNTFVARPTAWRDFVEAGPWPTVTRGEAIPDTFRGLNLGISHVIAAAQAAGHEVVPLAWGCAMPGGRVEDEAFDRMSAWLAEDLARARADVVYLELHGAMVTQSHDDGEGELLRRMRAVVGEGVPILVSLDLHGNISPAMVGLADFASSYRTYPHIDWGAAGGRCMAWLDRVLAWGGRPARATRQAPYLVPVTTGCTLTEPSGGLYRALEAIEAETGVHLSLNMGFPPADIPDVGPTVLAYGADQASVDAAADRLFGLLLAAEGDFAAHRPLPAEEAVAEAMRIAASGARRPVVLADTQDNPGAGAPSSTTGLIRELLRQGAERAVLGIVHDPLAARLAHEAGPGGTVDRLGGGGEGPGQEPVAGPWTVAALSKGRFRGTSPMLRAAETEMGPTALLRRDGVEVLVATIRQQPIHREVFTHLGVDLGSRAIVALKSSAHFRSGYQEIAERVIVTLSPGVNPEDPASFPFTKARPGLRLRPGG